MRDFVAKMVAAGREVVPEIQRMIPGTELHRLEKNGKYVMAVPGITVGTAEEIQNYFRVTPAFPDVVVIPLSGVEVYEVK
jgi:hypothetical protein